MSFQLPAIPENLDSSGAVYGFVAIAIAAVFVARLSRGPNLDAFPTVGCGGLFGSWLAGFKFFVNAADVVQEGYDKYESKPFKIPKPYGWIVVLNKQSQVEELARSSTGDLHEIEATNEIFNLSYALGSELQEYPYHIPIVRSRLTRNIATMYSEIKLEIVTGFEEALDLKGNEWRSMQAFDTVRNVVCKSSNRLFVGSPLCRDPDWVDINLQFTDKAGFSLFAIGLFPKILKPLAAYLMGNLSQANRRARQHLRPIIEERARNLNKYGKEWTDRPNDFLMWLMEDAEGSQTTVNALTHRVIFLNFAAIHTTSQGLTVTLFHLARNPQYIQTLREEVESIVEKEGWSKAALSQMHKVDSFVKEALRFDASGPVGLTRKAMRDYVFSDGTFIPKGTLVCASGQAIHFDNEVYENADRFEPFRYSGMREANEDGVKHQLVSTASNYLIFGHGKHACPGRFFAANTIKTAIAHILVTYDVKLEGNMLSPPELRYGPLVRDPKAQILFRKRVN